MRLYFGSDSLSMNNPLLISTINFVLDETNAILIIYTVHIVVLILSISFK